jgi:PIN domain nuclease of toxin-antitoxin system
MKLILDTAVFLWMIFGEESKITKRGVKVLEDEKNELFFSVVSAWEIAIKYSIGKLQLQSHPQKWLPDVVLKIGLQQLPVLQGHALAVADLPSHHKDPFDRLLITQAKMEGMSLVSPDPIFRKYRVKTIW